MGGNPGGDLARGGRGRLCGTATESTTVASDEVVDLVGGDVVLELLEARRGVGSVEASDGHDGLTEGELVARGVVGVDGRRDPCGARGLAPQEVAELGADRGPVEQAT